VPLIGEQTGRPVTVPRRRRKRTPPPRVVVQPNPDQRARTPPRRVYGPPAPAPRPIITRPPLEQPFTRRTSEARDRVRAARRNLPPLTVAAPPIVTSPTQPRTPGRDRPLTRTELQGFLASQSRITQAARGQIVTSIRRQVAGTSGRERQARLDRVIDEIRHDPRLAPTRHAIRYYTALEHSTARPDTAELKAGPQPRKARLGVGPFSLATVNLTATGRTLGNALASATPGLQGDSPESQITRNALNDLRHLPLMVPQTAYEVTAAAAEAAHGDTDRAKALAKGFTQGVYGHIIRGDWSGLEAYVRQHPVYAVLELRGFRGVVGRGTGAVMRSGAVGQKAARVASTRRPDLPLAGAEGGRVSARQHYSPDVFTKALQVTSDRIRRGEPVLRDHRLRRRADFESDMAASTSRSVRADEARQTQAAKPRGPLAGIVGLITQGVVRPAHAEADLRKELTRLDAAHTADEFTTRAQRRQNRTTATAIRAVLENPAVLRNLPAAIASGRENVRAINAMETRAGELEAITPGRSARAKLFPAAQAHLAAEYSDAPFRAARARERAAATTLRERIQTATHTDRQAAERVAAIVARHRSERGREAHHGPVAAYYVGDRRFTLKQEAVAHAKANRIPVRDIRRVALTRGEAKRVGELSAAIRARAATRKELKSLAGGRKDPHPLRRAFAQARTERIKASRGGTSSLHAPGGRRLSNQEIEAVVGEPVAYLPHHTRARGARAYYQTAFAGRKTVDAGKKRTGEAFRKGVVDVSYDAVAEHRQRLRGVVNRIAEHDRLIHAMAVKGPGGRMMTWDQAEKIAGEAAEHSGGKLVPYRAVPGSYDQARIQRIADSQNAAEMPDLGKLIGHEFEDRLKAPSPRDRTARNVVLLPEPVVNQLREQHAVSGTIGRVGNVAADVFRRTVLPFSTKWLVGNVVEAGVRLGAVGAGPNAYRIGRNLMRELDEIDGEQALRVRSALAGGLLFGNRGLTVRRFAEHFEGTAMATPAKALGTAGRLPVIRELGALVKGYTDSVFALNRSLESAGQLAALGKYAKREMQEMTGSWAKATIAQRKALHDVANGLMDSKNVHDAARYIDETLGQYSRFSPPMRRFIQSVAPFLPWYINAARWVLWTLPAKHPIKTGVMALAAQNLQADYDASHRDLPPGSLRGDVVIHGRPIPSSHYVPFGAFAPLAGGGEDALTSLVDPLFPAFKSAFLNLFGLNFAGRRAQISPGKRTARGEVPAAVRASMAVNSLLEAFIPAVGIARRIREGGRTGYDESTVLHPATKPGTDVPGGAANRILNPFRPTNIRAGAGTTQTVIPPRGGSSGGDLPASVEQALHEHALDGEELPESVRRALGGR
jgi:hypothetical protein